MEYKPNKTVADDVLIKYADESFLGLAILKCFI